MAKLKTQSDYPQLTPSTELLMSWSFKEGDLITNMATKAVWPATLFDLKTIKPELYTEHHKFRKMIPII